MVEEDSPWDRITKNLRKLYKHNKHERGPDIAKQKNQNKHSSLAIALYNGLKSD
jgi:5-formyltetrahydrofolate cyclo-ligase